MALKPEQIRKIVEKNSSTPAAPPRCGHCGEPYTEIPFAREVDWEAVAFELNEEVLGQLSDDDGPAY